MCTTSHHRAAAPAVFRLTRRWSAIFSAFTLLAAGLLGAESTAPGTGTIHGRVLNASNGAYLKNVNVQVAGTNLETSTDEFGDYAFVNVPVGERTVTAAYVGEKDLTVTVTVINGVSVTQDFTFRQTADTKLDKDGTVILDAFRVSADRYKNAAAVAIAEQRNSINIKNVVSTDAFGDIPNGNVGEFVKFLPGVQVDYGSFGGNNQGYADSDATSVSVRGFGPEDTNIMINGMPVASATPGSLTREVALDQLSINNASRVELIKVATPDMPANSMGGQVNLITKSAFEQANPSYSGRVFFNVNSLQKRLTKTEGPVNDKTYKIQPALEAGVVYPFTKNLGVSFDATADNEINQSYVSSPTWTTTGSFSNLAGVPISLSNPALTRAQATDISRLAKRLSTNLGVDWKPTPSQLIRANFQYSTYSGVEAQRRLDIRPTVAAGADWGPDYTIGTTANSTLAMTVFTRDRTGSTKQAQGTYSLKKGGWTVDAGASISYSRSEFKDEPNGHFSEIDYTLNPGQVTMRNVNSESSAPSAVTAVWRTSASGGLAGTDKVYTSLTNWAQDGTLAKSGQALNQETKTLSKLDIGRDLSFLPFLGSNTLKLQFGARHDEDKVEKSGRGTGYQQSLLTGANWTNAQVLDTNYLGQSPGFGLPAQEWASSYKLYEINKQTTIFGIAPADAVNIYASYANQQKFITETTTAYYAMLTGKFFKNRLSVLLGGRQETATRDGRGPQTISNWQYAKTSDGSLYRDSFYLAGVKYDGTNFTRTNADGTTTTVTDFRTDAALLSRLTAAGVKFPDHLYGTTTASVESRMLQLVSNYPIHGKSKGKPSFNLDLSYELTKKIDLKLSVSRAFKLPTLENGTAGLLSGNGSSGFTVSDNATLPADGTAGTITVANPNLKPESSINFDGEVAYYTDTGGRLSVGYWRKYVTDQIITNSSYSSDPNFAVIVDVIGLDPVAYDNYILKTSYNSATKQITSGWELQASQDLSVFGNWGKHFSGFLSYSFNTLGQPVTPVPYTITTPGGVVVPVTPTIGTIQLRSNRFGGAGLQFSSRRLSVQVRGTYRNRNQISITPLTGVDAGNFLRRFAPGATSIDLNAGFVLNKHYSLFLSGRNVLNSARKEVLIDDLGKYPAYAATAKYTESGIVWSFGVNGKW